MCRRGDNLFYIDHDGSVTDGPTLEISGSNMALDPKSGAMYFGGSYRSATGLEPYVNPYLYKVDANGKQVWTAYGWTGPIVGVDQLRLVADSPVTSIRIGEDGKLTLTAWSDGGNTVLGQQPYDLRLPAKCGGFSSSTSETMDVPSFTRYVGYLPTSDIPTLINIYDMYRLPNGEVAVTGGGWTGFVESHDAWVPPWYVEHRTDEFAMAKGGPFFTIVTQNGAFTVQITNSARKYGMFDTIPGGVWAQKLAALNFRIIFETFSEVALQGLTQFKGDRSIAGNLVTLDTVCRGKVLVGERSAPFAGKALLKFSDQKEMFLLHATFPFPGQQLGLAGAAGEGISATIYTASTPAVSRPEIR